MKRHAVVGILLAVIAMQLYAQSRLLDAYEEMNLKGMRDTEVLREVASGLHRQVAALSGERTRLEATVGRLSEVLSSMGPSATIGSSGVPETAHEPASHDKRVDTMNPLALSLLDGAAMEDLRQRREAIQPRPSDQILLQGSVADVLGDSQWNPSGRQLDSDEQSVLDSLMDEYRYFQRKAIIDLGQELMQPARKKLEATGAYIEYNVNDPPPVPRQDGKLILTMAKGTENPDVLRLFPFYPEDYPDMYHWHAVTNQRALERYVQIYELINLAQK